MPNASQYDFFVETIFGANTRQPLIRISFDDKEICVCAPEDAQALAMNLLQASQASLTDAFLFSFIREHIGVDDHAAAQVLFQFREWRQGREVK